MVSYLIVQSICFNRDFPSREKPREDCIRVKVRWILFGINGDQWFSPQKTDWSKQYLFLTLTLRWIFDPTLSVCLVWVPLPFPLDEGFQGDLTTSELINTLVYDIFIHRVLISISCSRRQNQHSTMLINRRVYKEIKRLLKQNVQPVSHRRVPHAHESRMPKGMLTMVCVRVAVLSRTCTWCVDATLSYRHQQSYTTITMNWIGKLQASLCSRLLTSERASSLASLSSPDERASIKPRFALVS